jgi:hypothetical protein
MHGPEGAFLVSVKAVGEKRMSPESLAAGFGESFGTLTFLFCFNFLMFPIMNSMERPKQDCDGAVANPLVGAAPNTVDLVLSNLGSRPFLSALKL